MKSEKISGLISRIEVVLAIMLFFAMLISCGLYIDIKMNGKSAALPPISDSDKKLLIRSVTSVNTDYSDDLIEPVFIGFKDGDKMIAATPDDASRRMIEEAVYEPLTRLFSGRSDEVQFSSYDVLIKYVEQLKLSDNYVLIGFFNDIPSYAFLPCILNNYETDEYLGLFDVKYLFLLPDRNEDLYAVAISSDDRVTHIYPNHSTPYTKITAESYDINDGWSEFAYDDNMLVNPVLTSTLRVSKYMVQSYAELYGKDVGSAWIEKIFSLFSINSNLVKSFTSGDDASINFVEDANELAFYNNGTVEYKAGEGTGIHLSEFLGYLSDDGSRYSFPDKIFALKNLINGLGINSVSHSISGFDYNSENDELSVYFKYSVDGIFLTNSGFDAVFTIKNDFLINAEFQMKKCSELPEKTTVYPQKYANAVLYNKDSDSNKMVFCPVLFDDESGSGAKSLRWSKATFSSEVSR